MVNETFDGEYTTASLQSCVDQGALIGMASGVSVLLFLLVVTNAVVAVKLRQAGSKKAPTPPASLRINFQTVSPLPPPESSRPVARRPIMPSPVPVASPALPSESKDFGRRQVQRETNRRLTTTTSNEALPVQQFFPRVSVVPPVPHVADKETPRLSSQNPAPRTTGARRYADEEFWW